ncbi:MAG: thiamine/thiamine pyrophosphate ABC transporter permease ThiP [Rhizobiaceae bacterium]|nr:thiamine/thiamine pyrophosphate ABC transporter permease ThiP [Rhizobiaceae bacterium]
MMGIAGPIQTYRLQLVSALAAGAILFALAIIILAQLLLFDTKGTGQFTGIFNDPVISRTLVFTLYQAGLSTIISLFFGILLAWALANRPHFPFRRPLIALISSALVLPTLVVVLGLVTVYGRSGWLAAASTGMTGEPLPFSIYGLTGILIVHVFFNASFAARILLHRFEAIAPETHRLGFSLGMGFIQKSRTIDFPAIKNTLPALAVTIFLLCFTSFAIVLTLGGSPAYNTLEVAIYEAIKFDFDLPRAFQLAMVQIGVCIALVLMAAANTNVRIPASVPGASRSYRHLNSPRQKTVQNLIITGFAIFFISPLITIVIDGAGVQLLLIFSDPLFQRAFITSMLIAITSTLLALLFSLPLASAMVTLSAANRLNHLKFAPLLRQFLSVGAMLYLVFPALVLGLGFFLLFQKIGGDQTLWAAAIVVIANALIAIPFGVATLRPAIGAAAKRNDRLCASLGTGVWLRWRKIDWPMLKSDITYVAALAFCFSLGDLGVIALFGSEEFRTLPWLLYQKFGSYRTDDASAIALVLLLIVITVFTFAQKRTSPKQSHPKQIDKERTT